MQILQPTPQAVYSGVINAASRISTTEGAKTLWRGINSVIMGAGPAHALYFATYEFAKESFGGNASGHHLVAAAAAGACATTAHDALMNPFDVIKQRMQVHGSVYRSVMDCASKVYRAEGLRAFYISYPTTLTMTIPFQSIQFATYEYLRKVLNPAGNYDPMTHIMAGGVAGAVAAATTTPLDVAKTLLQTRGESKDLRIRNCNGLFEAWRLIYQRQGLAGFAKGLQPRVLSHMPSTAICWSVYEYGKFLLTRENLDKQPIMT
ncbi:Fe(2+) transporter [Entomortierella chlamydospora]|nr:Fe(2+) transporter [Entomortierella chlamydospora]